jgi:hypothetical protein
MWQCRPANVKPVHGELRFTSSMRLSLHHFRGLQHAHLFFLHGLLALGMKRHNCVAQRSC